MPFVDTELFIRRARALQRAYHRAQNKEFKALWKNMLEQLIVQERARVTEKGHDTVH